jgi:hypothetical protein
MSQAPGKDRRKDIARAWIERPRSQGVFVVRCAATGQAWVASSPNLDTQQNSVWFSLRNGGHPNKAAQAAWTAHGPDAFTYEVLEQIEGADLTPLGLRDRLKTRAAHWREALGATALVG